MSGRPVATLVILVVVPAVLNAQTAGEKYKSVRVLNDIPASRIIEVMSVIAGSLGVTCAHCHESEFESDAKPMKQKARDMLRLTKDVDATFGGKGMITCNTCHQGKPVPPSFAPVEQAGWVRPKTAPVTATLPTVQQVLDRYVEALGGLERVQQVSKRTVTGKVTRDNGRTPPASGTFTLFQELPGTARFETEFSFPPEARSELLAEFLRARRARDLSARARVVGRGTIGSRPTVILEISAPADGLGYRLHFDEADGLLVAREAEKPTPVGLLQERAEISDYRDVGGIKQPFRFEWLRADYHVTFELETVK